MSVKVMTWVWDHSRAAGNDRLVLLAIADHCGDDGYDAFPKLATLAKKTGLADRTVRRCIDRLIDLGELVVEERAGGSAKVEARHRPHLYQVVMRPVTVSATTGQDDRSATGHGDRSIREPSEGQPSLNRSALQSGGEDPATALLRAWWDELVAAGEPTPAQPWPAMLQVVRAMLKAGHAESRVAWALRNSPTVSTGALTMAINRRLGKGTRRSSTATALDMMRAGR